MSDNKHQKPSAPPPPLFLGAKERDLVKQINDEILERILPYEIVYYAISYEHTNYHSIYGEAIDKIFYPPVVVKGVLIEWNGQTDVATSYVDRENTITVHFHKRRIEADQDLFVRIGDFIRYGDQNYEIVKIEKPRLLFGQVDHKFQISATCIRARRDNFKTIEDDKK